MQKWVKMRWVIPSISSFDSGIALTGGIAECMHMMPPRWGEDLARGGRLQMERSSNSSHEHLYCQD